MAISPSQNAPGWGWLPLPANLHHYLVEPCSKEQHKFWDILNRTLTDLTLGHIFTFPGQVKQKVLFFVKSTFLQVIFELRE